MSTKLRFVPYGGGRVCARCGSLVGRYDDREDFCPSPLCGGQGALPPGVDPSYLYRARALVFVPDADSGVGEGGEEAGRIIAVRPEEVISPVARRQAPVIATGVVWPRDRKRFGELFDHHIHHVSGPLIQPPNDGWDVSRHLPVL